jgi:hypothetical protein
LNANSRITVALNENFKLTTTRAGIGTDLDREHASSVRFDGTNQSVRADCGFYDDFEDDVEESDGVAAPLETATRRAQ